MDIEDQIEEIEEEIRKTPSNKATQAHLGRLKAKLAKLREEGMRKSATSKGGGYGVKKSGDATVVMVGFPSVGKSTLLNKLTSAESKIGDYDFTTMEVIPGAMKLKGALIQLLDVPGLVGGASSGRGKGREIISVVRSADLILIMVDVLNLWQLEVVEEELYNAGIRPNRREPDITIKKKDRGGINITSTGEVDESIIMEIASEYKLHNADIMIRGDISADTFIDALMGNRVYIPSLVVVNKMDLLEDMRPEDTPTLPEESILISASLEQNLDQLKNQIFEKLEFMRVYLKPAGEEATFDEPMIIKKGSSVGDVCGRLHRDFKQNFKYARVWGRSAKHSGQMVGMGHVLMDEDVLTINL